MTEKNDISSFFEDSLKDIDDNICLSEICKDTHDIIFQIYFNIKNWFGWHNYIVNDSFVIIALKYSND